MRETGSQIALLHFRELLNIYFNNSIAAKHITFLIAPGLTDKG